MRDPVFTLPDAAKTEEEIRFDFGNRTPDGRFEYVHPQKKRFRFRDRDYLVAIYNKFFKEWRCFQVTHFREVFQIDSELDEANGQIVIKCVGNEKPKDEVLTTFNLDATSDDTAFLR